MTASPPVMPDADLIAETERRYAATTAQRDASQSQVRDRGMVLATDSERVRQRAARVIIDTTAPLSDVDFSALERIIGANDLVASRFLASGLAASRAVGRIGLRAAVGPVVGWGTGSLVSPALLLTNHHVLGTRDDAAQSTVEFDYELLPQGGPRPTHTFALEPKRFFLSSPELDFTLVAVAPVSWDGRPLQDYGWNKMTSDPGKVVVGEKLNIIQHPEGRPKVLALRENELVTILDDFLHYRTDTNPGSSGSPVFNDQWEVVALHHSGVPKRNSAGQLLNHDGTVWAPAQGEGAIAWEANEGVRISRIVATLQAARLRGAAAALRKDALHAEPLTVDQRLAAAFGMGGPSAPPAAPPTPPAPPPVAPSPTAPPIELTTQDLADALAELSKASERPYYEPKVDTKAASAYYRPLRARAGRAPTIERLRALVTETHADSPRYKPAVELYPWIDLRPDLKLASIYSGQSFDAAGAIVEDFRIAAELATREASVLEAAEPPFNCEHVVPQSWFDHDEPMRGDLHHLFACEARCNSFRGNLPYHDFDPKEEVTRDLCGRQDDELFEPEAGKGAAARASLYMWLRYRDEVEWAVAGDLTAWLATLLAWHRDHPVDDYERHRNLAIQQRQGNRNPFVDHPEWARSFVVQDRL